MAKRTEVEVPRKPGAPRRVGGGRWPAHVVGLVWMSHLTTVMLEMVTPAVFGHWLDRRLNLSFLTLTGLVVGVPLGILHIYWLLKSEGWLNPPPKRSPLPPSEASATPVEEKPSGPNSDDSKPG